MASSNGKVSNGAGPSTDSNCPINHAEKQSSSPEVKTGSLAPPKRSSVGLMAQLKLLRQMSKRPVPTANGDGTYSQTLVRPKLRSDLSRIGMNGEFLLFFVLFANFPMPCSVFLLFGWRVTGFLKLTIAGASLDAKQMSRRWWTWSATS